MFSTADCLQSARNALGSTYVDTFIDSFLGRCDYDNNPNVGISNGSDMVYGMEAPVSMDFPESTGKTGSFTFQAQRIIYAHNCHPPTCNNNQYATVTPLDTSIASFSGEKNVPPSSVELDCKIGSSDSGWIRGAKMDVSVNNTIFGNPRGSSDGSFVSHIGYKTCLRSADSNCRNNTLYFKVIEVAEISHDDDAQAAQYNTPTASTNLDATSITNPAIVENGTITFTHNLKRIDGWQQPSSITLYDVTGRIDDDLTTIYRGEQNLPPVALSAGGTTTPVIDSISTSSLNLQPNTPTKVCSRVTYKKYKSLAPGYALKQYSISQTGTSTICVWVKDDRIMLNSGSKSSVTNGTGSTKSAFSPNGIETLESTGSSVGDTQTYSFTFVHQLKLSGDTSKSYSLEYYVERSTNGGYSYSPVSGEGTSGSPVRRSINADNAYVPVETNTWTSDAIAQGNSTPTVCERIIFRPKQVEVRAGAGSTSVKDNSWQSSTVCTVVHRQSPKSINLDANSSVIVDGVTNPTEPLIGSAEKRQFMFAFNIFNSEHSNRQLDTTYTIERLVYIGNQTKNWNNATIAKGPTLITTPTSSPITDSPEVTVADGQSVTVCERIKLNPYRFQIHTNADGTESSTPQAVPGSGYFAEICATVARPHLGLIDDGEIEVYSSSEATLDNASNYSTININGVNAYLMKKQTATVTYTHKLWRNSEKHTGDGTHQAVVTSPEEDITDLRYRFADPAKTFSVNYFNTTSGLPIETLATNSSKTYTTNDSNRNNPLFNDNIEISAGDVGEIQTKCQSIFYLSQKYYLQGKYYIVDGAIWSGDTSIKGVATPVRAPHGNPAGTVGQSEPGCVSVVRPYNFRFSDISITASQATAQNTVTSGTTHEAQFQASIAPNNDEYYITDIPNANVRYIGFYVDGDDAAVDVNSINYQGNVNSSSDPCEYFTRQNGIEGCTTLKEETQNIGPAGTAPTGKRYYPTLNGYSSDYFRVSYTVPDLSTNSKYCVAIGIQPPNSGDGFNFASGWAISNASCVNIGKYPNFQVWGGSIFTNGGTKTSTTKHNDKVFGSWGDFALIANGTISKTASGASLISGLAGYTTCKASPITIANNNCSSNAIGNAHITTDTTNFMQKILERYIVNPDRYINIATANPSNPYTIDTGTLRSGYNPIIIYNPTTNPIYIAANVTLGAYARSYANKNVPQVIIYSKGDILIDQTVGKIDAWLIAKGVVNTCVDEENYNLYKNDPSHSPTPALSASTCDKKLVISGPVVANQVLFNRTAGADAHTNALADPAEIIDLSPAVYLFSANEASGSQPITTYLQKLPPRY